MQCTGLLEKTSGDTQLVFVECDGFQNESLVGVSMTYHTTIIIPLLCLAAGGLDETSEKLSGHS
jgi:hypothetical protein